MPPEEIKAVALPTKVTSKSLRTPVGLIPCRVITRMGALEAAPEYFA
ncbi:MAG: hypothetical protein JWR11_40 [Mycobacterium sp.]|jgi:hypothetical protein|nr:hypothetical protein [Mycobacterium sp.]MDT5066314.1 hypothetical protein [Mycobacterium sp.]MDT5180588.1 hypothetical protein [Mycobacterium sp.]